MIADRKDAGPLLEMENVSVHFPVKGPYPFSRKRWLQAVTDVSMAVTEGETFGIVGESGCGKTTLANAMIGMVRPTQGTVRFEGVDLYSLKPRAFKEARRGMQMIFQDPFSSLNPRFTVYEIVREPLYIRGGASEADMKAKVLELLKLVGLDADDMYRYPSDFSGGQRQRIGIARAIILNPRFLVCDEPVSALDVSVHAQILNLLMDIQKSRNITYVFVSHNLAVVKNICQNMVVMYLGTIMESGASDAIFANPLHPYTRALLSAVLDIDTQKRRDRILLKGDIPSPIDPPTGCRFWQRCPAAMKGCVTIPPELVEVEAAHQVACHLISGFSAQQRAPDLDQPLSTTSGR
ncbi:MAG: ATP-binding cassette domain-containing protein [Candidatus Bipolaricaulis anaerobius]|nr:ATP-binding cassette domain-containing protein [Candidatus Bipolaricaulis anaerobius]MDD5763660.1 ATP-binding cassette domain-containing protein [Candidatus Bipolaricaulis anaerobius]